MPLQPDEDVKPETTLPDKNHRVTDHVFRIRELLARQEDARRKRLTEVDNVIILGDGDHDDHDEETIDHRELMELADELVGEIDLEVDNENDRPLTRDEKRRKHLEGIVKEWEKDYHREKLKAERQSGPQVAKDFPIPTLDFFGKSRNLLSRGLVDQTWTDLVPIGRGGGVKRIGDHSPRKRPRQDEDESDDEDQSGHDVNQPHQGPLAAMMGNSSTEQSQAVRTFFTTSRNNPYAARPAAATKRRATAHPPRKWKKFKVHKRVHQHPSSHSHSRSHSHSHHSSSRRHGHVSKKRKVWGDEPGNRRDIEKARGMLFGNAGLTGDLSKVQDTPEDSHWSWATLDREVKAFIQVGVDEKKFPSPLGGWRPLLEKIPNSSDAIFDAFDRNAAISEDVKEQFYEFWDKPHLQWTGEKPTLEMMIAAFRWSHEGLNIIEPSPEVDDQEKYMLLRIWVWCRPLFDYIYQMAFIPLSRLIMMRNLDELMASFEQKAHDVKGTLGRYDKWKEADFEMQRDPLWILDQPSGSVPQKEEIFGDPFKMGSLELEAERLNDFDIASTNLYEAWRDLYPNLYPALDDFDS